MKVSFGGIDKPDLNVVQDNAKTKDTKINLFIS
jgi:hypothetical protein